MKHTVTVIKIDANEYRRLTLSSDMLRYDSCFHARKEPDGKSIYLYLLSFTPERWKSFLYIPKIHSQYDINNKTYTDYLQQSDAFINALDLTAIIKDFLPTERGLSNKAF